MHEEAEQLKKLTDEYVRDEVGFEMMFSLVDLDGK